MDLGVFDARAGLLISRPHHQLSAAPSVSQITEFAVAASPGDTQHAHTQTHIQVVGLSFAKWVFFFQLATRSAPSACSTSPRVSVSRRALHLHFVSLHCVCVRVCERECVRLLFHAVVLVPRQEKLLLLLRPPAGRKRPQRGSHTSN